MKLIDGQKLADKIKDKVVKEIMSSKDRRPNLAIILVGDRKDSHLYVNLKEKEAKVIGIDTQLYRCPKDIPEKEIFDMIDFLNNDDSIDAILVQLPLPEGYDTDGIILAIDPKKDVDRFHPKNVEELFESCSNHKLLSPVFSTVLDMLKSVGCDLNKSRVCVLANSDIFGKTLAKTLECRGAKVQVAKARDKNLVEKTSQADILITAVGKKHFVTSKMIKKDAIIIDIGITNEGKKVYGDVDFEDVKDKVSYITPVPGGVGPMTIAVLFRNTLELYKGRKA